MDALEGTVKRVQPRYISIDEDIFDELDPYSLKVYMALRYEGDYSKECSCVKKSVAFLMESANIKRRQFFKSLNILEKLGLIKREDKLGDVSTYLVARTLNYFKNVPVHNIDGGVHDMHGGVHDMHGGVHQVHTDQYSFHKSFNNSSTAKKEKSNIVAIKKPKALRATAPALDLLKLFKIRHPKKPNEKVLQLIAAAVSLLNEKGTSLEEYLSYLNDCCSNWLYLPWGTRQRTNDEIAIILKPSIINDALAGKYEDKNNVVRN